MTTPRKIDAWNLRIRAPLEEEHHPRNKHKSSTDQGEIPGTTPL